MSRHLLSFFGALLFACGGEDEDINMTPGDDCLRCHDFSAAGTVFPHASAESSEGVSGITVTFRDADGREVARTTTSAAGNFLVEGELPAEYSVELSQPGVEGTQVMTSVTSGACNRCHTSGTRIYFP